MTSNIHDKLSELRSAQTETQTLVQGLTDKVDTYIDRDDARHEDLMKFRLESSKHLAMVATIVQDMKTEVDCTVNQVIPRLQQTQSSQRAQLKSHGWLIKAIVGVTLLAVLGGTVTSLATCEFDKNHAEAAVTTPLEAGRE